MSEEPGDTCGFVVEIHLIVRNGDDAAAHRRAFRELDVVDHTGGVTVGRCVRLFDAAGEAEDHTRRLLDRIPWAVGGRVWLWVRATPDHAERYVHWAYVRI